MAVSFQCMTKSTTNKKKKKKVKEKLRHSPDKQKGGNLGPLDLP